MDCSTTNLISSMLQIALLLQCHCLFDKTQKFFVNSKRKKGFFVGNFENKTFCVLMNQKKSASFQKDTLVDFVTKELQFVVLITNAEKYRLNIEERYVWYGSHAVLYQKSRKKDTHLKYVLHGVCCYQNYLHP